MLRAEMILKITQTSLYYIHYIHQIQTGYFFAKQRLFRLGDDDNDSGGCKRHIRHRDPAAAIHCANPCYVFIFYEYTHLGIQVKSSLSTVSFHIAYLYIVYRHRAKYVSSSELNLSHILYRTGYDYNTMKMSI